MFDNNTCKYLIIALVIALIIVLYLYFQKKSYKFEGMNNIPWTDNKSQYSKINMPSNERKKELQEKYMKDDLTDNVDHSKLKKTYKNIPQPMDDRPDLSQCQPCICNCYSDSDSDIIYVKVKKN